MPDDVQRSTASPQESLGGDLPLDFREFLRSKAEEFGIRDRHRRRGEWCNAILRLLSQIREWLRESDPEGLLDHGEYEVRRTEPKLGTYDAPAYKIRLGAAEVDVVPMSREVSSRSVRDASGVHPEFAGRVDLTDGLRKYVLYREVRDGMDHWLIRDEHNRFRPLDRGEFERILQELLS